MSTKRKSSLQQFNRSRLALIIIPLLAYFLPGMILMNPSDAANTARFLITIFIFTACSYPLAVHLFPLSRSGGVILSKPLGILSCSLFVWTLTYIKIGRLNLIFIFLSLFILAVLSWGPKSLREGALSKLKDNDTIGNIVIEETLFALALTVFCFLKGFRPDINGQEKFMDYGFMMSMLRNPELPANDMWLSGFSINYYYYGQYIYAFITKLSGIEPSVSYNISMCCSIALPFSMCYSIGQMLIDGARNHGLKCPRFFSYIAGILTAFAVMVFGNSHSFYYDENSIGNGLLDLFEKLGANVGKKDSFFYPDSTRFIGYNPDSSLIEGIRNGGDYTIEEFPFYSFLIGDLHAHVCSTMVVLLIFALAVTLVNKVYSSELTERSIPSEANLLDRIKAELSMLMVPEIIAISILLGICQMTNYWDFLIYFIFGSMLLLVINTYRNRIFSSIPGAVLFLINVGGILGIYLLFGYQPLLHFVMQAVLFAVSLAVVSRFPCTLSRTGAGMSFFFTVGSLVSLPFNMNFEMISNKLAPTVNQSPLYQLFILWGTHVLICITFFVFVIIFKDIPKGNKKPEYTNPVIKFFYERNPMDVFMCGSIVVGLLLLLAPELFYVRDIYTGGYLRSNTMFKFTYAGFIILSICMIYSVIRLMFIKTRKDDFSMTAFIISIVFCALLLIPAHYTLASLKQRNGDITLENYRTLDGTAYLSTYVSSNTDNAREGNLADYDACINWFNENVDGDPVILEAYGLSYTDNNIVSAYTGLPAVCGWQTHEWLWRFHGIVDKETDLLVADPERDVWDLYLTPRHIDIDTIYTSSDQELVLSLLRKYNVRYVILGDLERFKYGGYDNTATIASLGDIVFVSGNLCVIGIYT